MADSDITNVIERFIDKFKDLKQTNFYDLVPFREPEIGLSVKRKYKSDDNKVSLIKVGFFDRDEGNLRKLYVGAAFGELKNNSLKIRSRGETKISDPLDIESRDDYFYDLEKNALYRGEDEISGGELLDEFYKKHIKTTRVIRGFRIRFRIWFWRVLLKETVEFLSKSLSLILYTISGVKYKHDPILELWKEDSLKNSEPPNSKFQEGSKFEFLGYKATRWSIVFYSTLNLALYLLFYYLGFRPTVLVILLKNNFLTLIYVIVSLSIVESGIPWALRYSIKYLSNLSFNLDFKKIEI
jgi:hypothetical protein